MPDRSVAEATSDHPPMSAARWELPGPVSVTGVSAKNRIRPESGSWPIWNSPARADAPALNSTPNIRVNPKVDGVSGYPPMGYEESNWITTGLTEAVLASGWSNSVWWTRMTDSAIEATSSESQYGHIQ